MGGKNKDPYKHIILKITISYSQGKPASVRIHGRFEACEHSTDVFFARDLTVFNDRHDILIQNRSESGMPILFHRQSGSFLIT